MIKSKYEKLKHIYKCEYFKSYPKYIANYHHHHHGIQNQLNSSSLSHLSDSDCKSRSPSSTPQLQVGKWSSMKSKQKMYKLKKSLHSFARTLTPRLHNQNSDNSNDSNDHDDNKTAIELQYLFGRKFCYWSYGKKNSDPFYVKPKEKSLKDELTKKNRLNIWQWNITYAKAQQFMKCNNCKKLKANKGWEEKYKIHYFDDISIEHIISILIYCNKHKLRYDFISTFHPLILLDDHELNGEWLKRHRRYAIIGRLLRESVECFGFAFGMKNEHEKIYYGIDTQIMFTKLEIGLYSLSTTPNLFYIFSLMMNTLRKRNDNGLILEITNAKYPYYFAANWLSLYSSENEYLFFGANEFVKIHSIIDCNYKNTLFSDYFYFINSFKILSEIINGKWSEEEYDKKTQKSLKKIIEYGLGTECGSLNHDITRRYDTKYHFNNPYDGYDENDEYFHIENDIDEDEFDDIDDELPQYIRNFFDCYFCQQIDFISIDLGILDSCFGATIRRFFVSHSNGGDEIKYNNLISLFPKTKQIKIIGRHEMRWAKYHINQLTEFLQFDSYLNDILKEIIFEFPSQHCLVYEDDIILKNVLNKNKFKQELIAYGWNVLCTDEKGIIKFYKENNKYKKKTLKKINRKNKNKNNKTNHKKTFSLILTNGQSNGLKKLVKKTVPPSSLDDSHLKNQRDKPIFFPPKANSFI